MKFVNTKYNKATLSAAVNALIVLINGRLPETIEPLSADEVGMLMTVVSFLVVALTPNKSD